MKYLYISKEVCKLLKFKDNKETFPIQTGQTNLWSSSKVMVFLIIQILI